MECTCTYMLQGCRYLYPSGLKGSVQKEKVITKEGLGFWPATCTHAPMHLITWWPWKLKNYRGLFLSGSSSLPPVPPYLFCLKVSFCLWVFERFWCFFFLMGLKFDPFFVQFFFAFNFSCIRFVGQPVFWQCVMSGIQMHC